MGKKRKRGDVLRFSVRGTRQEQTDETIGTTVLEVGAAFGMHAELLRLFRP